MCEEAYRQMGAATFHKDHTHSRHKPARAADLRMDLAVNDCKRVLGEYWYD